MVCRHSIFETLSFLFPARSQHIIFVTRGVFLFEPCAYCWQSRKCFARALCANASAARAEMRCVSQKIRDSLCRAWANTSTPPKSNRCALAVLRTLRFCRFAPVKVNVCFAAASFDLFALQTTILLFLFGISVEKSVISSFCKSMLF